MVRLQAVHPPKHQVLRPGLPNDLERVVGDVPRAKGDGVQTKRLGTATRGSPEEGGHNVLHVRPLPHVPHNVDDGGPAVVGQARLACQGEVAVIVLPTDREIRRHDDAEVDEAGQGSDAQTQDCTRETAAR